MAYPSLYNRARAEAFCSALAAGATVQEAAEKIGLARASTIFKWIDRHEEFAVMYRTAQSARAFAMAEEMMQLADSPLTGDAKAKEAAAQAQRIAHLKLQIDTRKWLITKMNPRAFEPERKQAPAPRPEVVVLSAQPLTIEEWQEKYGATLGAAARTADSAD